MKSTYKAYRFYLNSENELHKQIMDYLEQYPQRSRGQVIIQALNSHLDNRGSPKEMYIDALQGIINRIEAIEKRMSNGDNVSMEDNFLRRKFKDDDTEE